MLRYESMHILSDVKPRWVPTTQQQADIFTKALAAPVFEHFRKQLMAC